MQDSGYDRVTVLDSAAAQRTLAIMRDKSTPPRIFREALRYAGRLAMEEVLTHQPSVAYEVETPCGVARASKLCTPVHLTEILRAGRFFGEGAIQVLDALGYDAVLGQIDGKRLPRGPMTGDKFNFDVAITMFKVDPVPEAYEHKARVQVWDPMLATGGTLIGGIQKMKERGCAPGKIDVVTLLAAPYGIEAVLDRFPEAHIFTFAIDAQGQYKGLNGDGYIVPGLGDAGDRAFGTKGH